MGTPRHLTAAFAALLTLGLVGGCTDDSPDKDSSSTKDGSKTAVALTEVKGTQALRPKTTVIGAWKTLVSGKRSTVLAELTEPDGKPAHLFAVEPTTGTQHPLDVTAPMGWSTSANAKTAVLAGDVSQDHIRKPFVRISSDLKDWKEVPISYPEPGWSFSDVGRDGDVPLVIAQRPDGGEVLMRHDGDAWTTHALPAAKGQEISPIDLVEHRGQLVLLTREAKRGDESITRVLTSTDGGATWERGAKLAGAKGTYGVAGVVSTGKGLVATGWADRKAPMGTSGMVWTSADGKDWTRQRTASISWAKNVDNNEDFHLSGPTLVKGHAVFDQTCETCTWTTRFETSGAGTPTVTDNQRNINAAQPSTGQLTGRSAGVRREQGSLRIFENGRVRDLVKGEIRSQVDRLEHVGGTTLVPVGRFTFTKEQGENQWHTTTQTAPFVLDGTLKQQAWQPHVMSSWSGLTTAADPQGKTTVAVGTRYDEDFMADSRAVTGGKWKKPTGLGRFWHEVANGVTWADDAFRLQLSVKEEGSTRGAEQARIYSATDGSTWSPDRGTWVRHADAGSQLHDVCELPDGTPFAVGSSQSDPNGRHEATTWTRTKGRWNLDVPKLPGAGAETHACATVGDTTVISGSVDGDGIEWTTQDGKSFTAGPPRPRDTARGEPVEVDGGLVAPGVLDTAEHAGPVVWFSKDGKTWQWAPIDGVGASSSVQVRAAGDKVYAVTSQTSGDRIWTIDEIATTKVTGGEG